MFRLPELWQLNANSSLLPNFLCNGSTVKLTGVDTSAGMESMLYTDVLLSVSSWLKDVPSSSLSIVADIIFKALFSNVEKDSETP